MADDAPVIPDHLKRAEALVADMLANPEFGGKVRARAKELFPDAGLTFVEDRFDPVAARLEAALAEERTKREALEATIAADKEARETATRAADFTSSMDQAWSKYRLTPEGREMAIERMRATSAYDADAAAAWAAMQNPVVKEPSKAYLGPGYAPIFTDINDNDTVKSLYRDPEGGFLDRHFQALINDPDGYAAGDGPAL